MNRELSIQEIVSQYIETGVILTETALEGDYKRGNKIAKINRKMFEKMKKNESLLIPVLEMVMISGNDSARTLAAVDSLRTNVLTEIAVCVLRDVAKRTDIIGFEARTALQTYMAEITNKPL